MEEKENILGYEKIGKLIRKFSIPAIISLLVNSLYNIVDQIFIGWGVGYLGNGATNIVFPIIMLSLAIALMFGDGAAAYLSLKLGEQKKKEASKGVANAIAIATIVAIVFCTLSLIFLPQLLNVFGCTDVLRELAQGYGYIIVLGLPFMIIGTTLNSIIRADGNPKYAMKSMVIGAALNVALDPIFIFVLNMGVEGAAIATVISQVASFIINVIYIKKFKTITLTRDEFKLKASVVKRVLSLGISSFITQISIVFVIAFTNNLLAKYGAESKYGAEIPITVLGIVMKISQILNSIIIGIAAGSQPIIGYNYGAKKYERVRQTLKIVLGVSVIISVIAFVLFQTIPDKLISIFGAGDENYMEFACLAFRIYLMLCIATGIQIPAGIFFQSIGKSAKSAVLSLSRQVLFLIPALLILGNIFGIYGILYAGATADGLALIVALSLLAIEIRRLKGNNALDNNEHNENVVNEKSDKHIVITISREYGSGGRYIGKLVANKLGIKLYDKEFVSIVAKQTGLAEEYIENNEQRRLALANLNNGYNVGLNNSDDLFIKESEAIIDIANNESCVIIGRCADFILRDRKDVISVFVYSTMEDKIKRAIEFYELDKDKAEKEINKMNKLRAKHYKYYAEREWNNPENYDICINCASLGVEGSANLICSLVNNKNIQNFGK